MNTVLLVGLATLAVLLLVVVAIHNQWWRSGIVSLVLLASLVFALTSTRVARRVKDFVLRAQAPVPDDVLLFTTAEHAVFAIKACDATLCWKFALPDSLRPTSLVVQDGVVYVNTDPAATDSEAYVHANSGLFALAANDGHLLWHNPAAIILRAGSIGNGMIVGASSISAMSTNQFAAINASNGQQLWRVPASIGSENVSVSNLVLVGGLVLLGTQRFVENDRCEVLALDQASGQQMWKIPLTAGFVLWLTTDSDGIVYGGAMRSGTRPSLIFALDPLTRTLLWEHPLSNFPQPILTIDQHTLYVGSGDAVLALDAHSGNEIWHLNLEPGTWTAFPIVIDHDVVYLGARGTFSALHASDGSLVWKHTNHKDVGFGPPLVSHGVVFSQTSQTFEPIPFLGREERVSAFRASDGHEYYRKMASRKACKIRKRATV